MKYYIELYSNYLLHPYIYIFLSIIVAIGLFIFICFFKKQKVTFKQIKTFLLFDIAIYLLIFIICFIAFNQETITKGIHAILGIGIICLISSFFDDGDD